MKIQINDKTYGEERALYALRDAEVFGCVFEGDDDGESALKECSSLRVHNCRFALRYPLWHGRDIALCDCAMTDTCRAPFWYNELLTVRHCRINGVKALRECNDTLIEGSAICSDEFGWRCDKVNIRKTDVTSEYFLLGSRELEIDRLTLNGKYSFQYVENATISNSVLNTKDAFWHVKDVTVTDSVINGEYLGWYSEGLTLINCKIVGTQPLCYCKRLRLVNCVMENADLAFEYSDVEADIDSELISVKNPRSGYIRAKGIGEVINEGSIMECNCKIHIDQGAVK